MLFNFSNLCCDRVYDYYNFTSICSTAAVELERVGLYDIVANSLGVLILITNLTH